MDELLFALTGHSLVQFCMGAVAQSTECCPVIAYSENRHKYGPQENKVDGGRGYLFKWLYGPAKSDCIGFLLSKIVNFCALLGKKNKKII